MSKGYIVPDVNTFPPPPEPTPAPTPRTFLVGKYEDIKEVVLASEHQAALAAKDREIEGLKNSGLPQTVAVKIPTDNGLGYFVGTDEHGKRLLDALIDRAEKAEAERDALRTLWTEARVVVAQCRDANCLVSYGKAQCDAVAAANAWLDKMPATVKRTIDDASNTEWQLQRVIAERDQLRAEVERLKAMTQTPAGRTERGEWKPECNSLYVYDAEGKLIGSNHPIAAVAEEYRLRYERIQLRADLAAAQEDKEREIERGKSWCSESIRHRKRAERLLDACELALGSLCSAAVSEGVPQILRAAIEAARKA